MNERRGPRVDIVPCTIGDAKSFVSQHHRHHRAPNSALWALSAAVDETVVGVAIVGRPKARMLDDGFTAEVVRCCTDGTKNACSALYSAAWRAARALGYRRLVTYTLPSEGGASLVAAGWRIVGETAGGTWSRADRPRVDKHPTQEKLRWEPIESRAVTIEEARKVAVNDELEASAQLILEQAEADAEAAAEVALVRYRRGSASPLGIEQK